MQLRRQSHRRERPSAHQQPPHYLLQPQGSSRIFLECSRMFHKAVHSKQLTARFFFGFLPRAQKNLIIFQVYQEPGYRFSSNSASYYIPDEAREHAAFVDYVKQLPIQNDPTVFGLHENADIAKANRETKELFEGVLKTLPKEVLLQVAGSL